MSSLISNYKFSNNSSNEGATISARHFGSSFENRGQSVDQNSTFRAAESKLNLEYLRYPGGTQTENYFDPGNPNNSNPNGTFNNPDKTAKFVPISEFLNFTKSENIEAVIVIPTWRYFNKKTGDVTSEAEAEIKDFVHKLLTGKYGNAEIEAIEIGNEWHNENFTWTPAQFGNVQAKIATWIHEVKAGLNLANDPKILAQTSQIGDPDSDKNGVKDNVEILAAFKGQEMKIIDGVIDHFYQPTRAANPLDDYYLNSPWVPQNRVDRMADDGWKVKGPGALDIYITEWNVRDSDRDQDQTITGFERFPMFLRLFSEMQLAGVDAATVFSTQALGKSHAPLSRLGETGLTPTGHLFKMMKDALPGTRIVDPNGNGTLSRDEFVFQDTAGRDVGLTYTFSSKDKTVVYFSSAVNNTVELNADFKALIDQGFQAQGIITKPAGGNAQSAGANAKLETVSPQELDGKTLGDGIYNIKLGAYELIQLEFTKKHGKSAPDNTKKTAPDAVNESTPIEQTTDNKGNDVITGGQGNDTLNGGQGNDKITGGAGADILSGGQGSDHFIFTSHTESRPGKNNRDTITDFEKGVDKIDLSGIDASSKDAGDQSFKFIGGGKFSGKGGDIKFVDTKDGTVLKADLDGDKVADFVIRFNNEVSFTADDFIL